MNKFWWLALVPALFFCSCNPPQSERTEALQEEIEEREIKKISEGELNSAAFQLGDSLTSKTQQLLASNLKMALQRSGISGAVKYCNIQAYPLVDSVESAMDVEIRRTALRVRNQANKPTEVENRILEAYQYNQEQNAELNANLQDLDDGYILYTKPIVINNPLCLNCHGKVGEAVSKENYQIIKNLYPTDSAVGFAMGDLRGMWSVTIAKKEIIKQF